MNPEFLFTPADILLPQKADMRKWSVIACDQYTSQPEYWDQLRDYVGNAPSSLHMVFPEAYLNQDDENRIASINRTMQDYLQNGLFRSYPESFFYVERTLLDGSIRRGLIGKLDLMQYEYGEKSQSLIRPTEKTVESRIPPRVKIREYAALELPHIMVLIDDPGKSVIEPVSDEAGSYETLYDFDLWEGGRIRGKKVPKEKNQAILAALDSLFSRHYDQGNPEILVGDGNHSLATAKACFEKLRQTLPKEQWINHPSRWALTELVNLQDSALKFEPVHRVVFDTDPKTLLYDLQEAFPAQGNGFPLQCMVQGQEQTIPVGFPAGLLPIGPLQKFLDAWLHTHAGILDYIHDDGALRELASRPGSVGFLLPPMEKDALVPTVQQEGSLPRKTFSLGHSCEKRYYLEARKILP